MAGAVAPGAVQRAEGFVLGISGQQCLRCRVLGWCSRNVFCPTAAASSWPTREGDCRGLAVVVPRCNSSQRNDPCTSIHLQLHCTSVLHLYPPEHRPPPPPRVNLPPHRAYSPPHLEPPHDPESAASLHRPPCRPECSRDNGLEAPAPGLPSSSWYCSVRCRPMCAHVISANRCR